MQSSFFIKPMVLCCIKNTCAHLQKRNRGLCWWKPSSKNMAGNKYLLFCVQGALIGGLAAAEDTSVKPFRANHLHHLSNCSKYTMQERLNVPSDGSVPHHLENHLVNFLRLRAPWKGDLAVKVVWFWGEPNRITSVK